MSPQARMYATYPNITAAVITSGSDGLQYAAWRRCDIQIHPRQAMLQNFEKPPVLGHECRALRRFVENAVPSTQKPFCFVLYLL